MTLGQRLGRHERGCPTADEHAPGDRHAVVDGTGDVRAHGVEVGVDEVGCGRSTWRTRSSRSGARRTARGRRRRTTRSSRAPGAAAITAVATTAAVSTRSTWDPSETARAERHLGRRPPALRTDGHRGVGAAQRPATRLGQRGAARARRRPGPGRRRPGATPAVTAWPRRRRCGAAGRGGARTRSPSQRTTERSARGAARCGRRRPRCTSRPASRRDRPSAARRRR